MDFMADQLFRGQRIRVLTIVDIFSTVSPVIGVGFSYKGCDVVDTLDQAVEEHGCPKRIRLDNGPKFVSRDPDLWACAKGVVLDFSRPGQPTDNAYIETFNSRFRQECLKASWFLSLEDARLKIEAWREEYNTVRPHTAIGHMTPRSNSPNQAWPDDAQGAGFFSLLLIQRPGQAQSTLGLTP